MNSTDISCRSPASVHLPADSSYLPIGAVGTRLQDFQPGKQSLKCCGRRYMVWVSELRPHITISPTPKPRLDHVKKTIAGLWRIGNMFWGFLWCHRGTSGWDAASMWTVVFGLLYPYKSFYVSMLVKWCSVKASVVIFAISLEEHIKNLFKIHEICSKRNEKIIPFFSRLWRSKDSSRGFIWWLTLLEKKVQMQHQSL